MSITGSSAENTNPADWRGFLWFFTEFREVRGGCIAGKASSHKSERNASLCTLLDKPFGDCEAGHPQLFTVNAGIAPHDALVHVSLYLRCAYDTGNKAFDGIDESAKGLVEALLDALENRELSQV